MSDTKSQNFIKTSIREEKEKQENFDVLERLVKLTEDERNNQKTYIYDKLYKFLGIDLTIFPIITTLFFIYLPTANDFIVILAFFSFFIAVIYKFGIILRKLESYLTPTNAYDNIEEDKRKIELIYHRMDKTKHLDEYNEKLIELVNHSICFTLNSIVISITNVFQQYIIKILPISIDIIQFFLLMCCFIVFALSVFYKGILRKKIKLFSKKLIEIIGKKI